MSTLRLSFTCHPKPTKSECARDSRLVSLLYGTHGVRLDREFAVQSLLNERYALFLKVYTHRSKISASALLGKGLVELTHPKDGTEGLNEADYEWMSDFAVLERLAHSESNVAKDAAARLMQRRLPRATYRAPLLSSDDQQLDMYEARRTHMQSSGVFSVDGRRQVEAELAGVAGLSPHEVIVYCPQRAPGYQMVEHHISSTPGNTSAVDHVKKPYHTLRGKHLGLWEIWVFSVGDPSRDSVLTHAAYERFGFENRLTDDRRQERSA